MTHLNVELLVLQVSKCDPGVGRNVVEQRHQKLAAGRQVAKSQNNCDDAEQFDCNDGRIILKEFDFFPLKF